MTNRVFIITTQSAKINAINAIETLKYDDKMIVEIKKQKRSLDQNSKLWAMLTDVAGQSTHCGERFTAEDWKHLFTARLKNQKIVLNLDGDGVVTLGKSTSKMTRSELADLITIIQAFGAGNGVKFRDTRYDEEGWVR